MITLSLMDKDVLYEMVPRSVLGKVSKSRNLSFLTKKGYKRPKSVPVQSPGRWSKWLLHINYSLGW